MMQDCYNEYITNQRCKTGIKNKSLTNSSFFLSPLKHTTVPSIIVQ